MISPDRLLSQGQIYNFLRTVTIKYEPLADHQNAALLRRGYAVNDQDRSTWKYYQNMVGQYHVSDTPMQVMSIDTHETILFSVNNLKNHPRTKAAYVPGGPYYNRLCDTYPEQVDLIKSILFPVDSFEKAITSPDLTMLNYGSGYLEEYEESVLVMKVEEFLRILEERWYFSFLDDEPYYHVTFWASLWTHLAAVLMTARVEHIRTPYVHSFDLWSYLESQGLDNYSDILSREKSMMLYQNMTYFINNAGKQSNLDILAVRLLSDLGIGVYGRIVVQQAEKKAEDYQLVPQLVPIRLPVVSDALPAPIEIKTVSTIQSEIFEKGLTDSNSAEMVATIERKLGDTRLNDYATKFLEIRPVAQNKPYAETLNAFLMETLIVSVNEGYFTKPIEIREPLTNELIFLTPKELLALYDYAVFKSIGVDLEDFTTSVRIRHAFDTVIGTPKKKIPYEGGELYVFMGTDADQYLSGLNYDTRIESPQEFTDQATRLWLRYMEHLLADQDTKIESVRTVYKYLDTMCHTRRDMPINLVTGFSNYTEWLGPTGINFSGNIVQQFGLQEDVRQQWSNLADTIISALIPINDTLRRFGNFTLSNAGFERIRQLFVQMCSYRVVFLQSDRETSEYAIGAKWSTGYEPTIMNSFSNFVVTMNTQTADKVKLHGLSEKLPGVTEHVSSKSTSHTDYSVTTPVVEHKNRFHQRGESLHADVIIHNGTVTAGTFHLGRSAVVAEGLFPSL